jgi:long-subunit fatty acid transport protein
MSKIRLLKIFTAVAFIFVALAASAQQRTYLPYSIFGIGEINTRGFSRNMGMGKSGIGMSSDRYLNNKNPASYHTMDSISFFYDLGLSGSFVKYKNSYTTQKGQDFNVGNLAIGFRVTKNLTSSVGVAPYSTVGYKTVAERNVEGTQDLYTASMTGSGGLTKFYWDNAYLLFNHLSVGVSFTYLFGNIETSEIVEYENLDYSISSKAVSHLNKLYADFGLQYRFKVKDDFKIIIGGIFGNSHKLNFEQQVTISQSDGTVFEDELTTREPFELPMYYGAGFSVGWADQLTFNAEYEYHNWSSTPSNSTSFTYRDTKSYRVGVELIPDPLNKRGLGYFGIFSYRLGLYHEDSNLDIKNATVSNRGLSFGLGLPFMNNKTSLNLAYNTGIRGTIESGLIRENYNTFFVSLTLHDWWFIKPKYD